MTGSAFFDTNMLLGYCVLVDQHHEKCREFVLEHQEFEFYVSESVEREYRRKKGSISSRLETGVLKHVQKLQRTTASGYLDAIALDSIQRSQIETSNPAYQFLHEYYASIKSRGMNKGDLTANLRNLARSIHVIGDRRRETLDHDLQGWIRYREYPTIEARLDIIHEPDRSHCIDAHDLAVNQGKYTVFVSSDVKDIVDNSALITGGTAIDEIADVSV